MPVYDELHREVWRDNRLRTPSVRSGKTFGTAKPAIALGVTSRARRSANGPSTQTRS